MIDDQIVLMTKSKITRVGKRIREKLKNNEEVDEKDILDLQDYRISFQSDLKSIFKKISTESKRVRNDSIVTYRIKRIESILSKIQREPNMALGNMGDIAGCRIILYSENALLTLLERFESIFKVRRINNYLEQSKEDGYCGCHLYIESPLDENKLIEIQLRTVNSHRWASLVEIVDILYDTKIKEGEKNKDFQDFLYLMSKKEQLSIDEKYQIIEIDERHKIYQKLNEVFRQNNIQVRQNWILISELRYEYFIIEVDQEKKSTIMAFDSYEIAENKYFEMFESKKMSNFVLTYIVNPSFERVCIAYASYLLVNPNYLKDWSNFTLDVIDNDSLIKSQTNLEYYREYIKRNLEDQIELIKSEIAVYNSHRKNEVYYKPNDGLTEWLEELQERMNEIDIISKKHNNIQKPKNISFFKKIFG